MCISDYVQSTSFYLGRFQKKLAHDQCSLISKDSICHNKYMAIQPFTKEVDLLIFAHTAFLLFTAVAEGGRGQVPPFSPCSAATDRLQLGLKKVCIALSRPTLFLKIWKKGFYIMYVKNTDSNFQNFRNFVCSISTYLHSNLEQSNNFNCFRDI